MRTNIERHAAASNDRSGPVEEKRFVTWGSDTPEDLVLDREKLAEALKKEDERKKEEKDERKRKYNVQWNDQITPEEMEAYRMKRIHEDDPMKNLLH
ncbi:BnaAnng22310D [Brassica napus]|nr:BnaAnng22310D [Brassica napus]